MDYMKLKEQLSSVAVTTATPFSKDLSEVDSGGLKRNLEFLLEKKISVIVPCGNTGEFYSLSKDEWIQVVETTVNAAGEEATVVAGIGHSLKTAIGQLHKTMNLGAHAVMVMYPQHVFVSEEGALDYYRRILDEAKDIGVVLYKKGPHLSDDVLLKLTGDPLVAVKYAFGRIADFARSVQRVGKRFVWSCGTAERFTPFFWLAGATAFTSGLGNFAPSISLRMLDALLSSDYKEAMKIQQMITPLEYLREGRDKANNVPVVKVVMDHLGLVGGGCRPPIHLLSDEERTATVDSIADWGL
ncbi:MAG: dihydrodipicolinate synthase family protein [Candidatus Thorarchaeota archaeon]|nr:MAG: dihydrodipicolinate synthase family protein [Candidatus Thorarchaeota archaeon]